ncbi:hypothetical protein [Haloarchaeobius sp. HRN-SO-5]|uniref:hypothetical protein n=1 Tax=Haloarchaeobius sp. HRN-SO-5 TaxID=3446118 RepID=UPI003EBC8044
MSSFAPLATEYSLVTGIPFLVVLALAHLFRGRWWTDDQKALRWWLSAAGGASVAYVFVLLLPEVSEAALTVGQIRGDALLAEQEVYVVALVGFVAFYGIEVFVTRRRDKSVEDAPLVYWSHLAVFTVYSAIIGYLLFHQEAQDAANQFFYVLAMAFHFRVTDYGLYRHHGQAFDRTGRWILTTATLVGGVAGFTTEFGGLPLAMAYGFVAGAIVFNVVKEELPDVDESRFTAFGVGTLVYTVVLLLV